MQRRGWGQDEAGASPLTVIVTFVLVASGITAIAFLLLVGDGPEKLALQEVREDGLRAVEVTAASQSRSWTDLAVSFIDPAGADHAGVFLALPDGEVDAGDRITFRSQPPAGTYLLRIQAGGDELARMAISFE